MFDFCLIVAVVAAAVVAAVVVAAVVAAVAAVVAVDAGVICDYCRYYGILGLVWISFQCCNFSFAAVLTVTYSNTTANGQFLLQQHNG